MVPVGKAGLSGAPGPEFPLLPPLPFEARDLYQMSKCSWSVLTSSISLQGEQRDACESTGQRLGQEEVRRQQRVSAALDRLLVSNSDTATGYQL
jgi:hypothetical protein